LSRSPARIPCLVVPSAEPAPLSPRSIAREFRALLASGARIRCVGSARRRPAGLLARGYVPRHRVDLFGTAFYLTGLRQNPELRFFVAYVVPPAARPAARRIHPRIFYKDVSLVWRSASHYVRSSGENWIGKGEPRTRVDGDDEIVESDEATTDLPLELQNALESLTRLARRVPADDEAVALVLRRGHHHRIEAYRDFTEPRRRARAHRRNLIHGGRSVARFTRPHDPSSLVFVRGFEPDFARGILEVSESSSRLYGGRVRRFRILSRNREIQYLFLAGPRHVWIIPPQATTTELSSYGVRTIDVVADDDLFVPGYEYHFMDETEDPPVLHSQIPERYVGAASEVDPSRADASAWLDRLPIVREFRRVVLGERARRSPRRSARAGGGAR
jgi:hypothetical protein